MDGFRLGSIRLSQWVIVTVALLTGTVSFAQENVAVESLIQANPVLYVSADGLEQHRETYEKTAAYKAFYESGLVDSIFSLVDQFGERGALAKEVSQHLLNHGGTFAVNLPEPGGFPIPRVTIVLPEAAKYADPLKSMIVQILEQEGPPVEPEELELNGRTIFRVATPEPPIVEVGLWTEGNHLVLAGGIGAIQATINVAEGDINNVTTSRCWQEYIAPAMADSPIISRCWFDFEQIRKNFGQMPIPSPDGQGFVTVDQLLEIVGLHEFRAAVMFSSLAGEETVQSIVIETPSPAKGVMTVWDPAPLDLEQEFVLPPNVMVYGANSVDLARIYDACWEMVEELITRINPRELEEIQQVKSSLPEILGFDPKADLIDCFGQGTHVCIGAEAGLFSMPSFMFRQKVNDEETLKQTLTLLAERAAPLMEESDGTVSIRHSVIEENQVTSISFMGMLTPSLVVSDGWLLIGSSTQAIRAQWMRERGELSAFQPDPLTAKRLKNLPEGTISYGISDPSFAYQQFLALAPMYIGMGQQMLIKEGILAPDAPLPDFPPAELITKHIKPNFTVIWRDNEKMYAEVFTSVPDISTGIASGAVLVALLLPAIEGARMAAERPSYEDVAPQLEFRPGISPTEESEDDLDQPIVRPRPGKRRPLPLPAPEK
ncbi:MAG: hypothetical protein KDA65_10810 [Planctomycetaceae bacterium]|nr:hypothetical protein [Planctomycetaceae bacterium]